MQRNRVFKGCLVIFLGYLVGVRHVLLFRQFLIRGGVSVARRGEGGGQGVRVHVLVLGLLILHLLLLSLELEDRVLREKVVGFDLEDFVGVHGLAGLLVDAIVFDLFEDGRLLSLELDVVAVLNAALGEDDPVLAQLLINGDDFLEVVFVEHEGVEPELDEEEQLVLDFLLLLGVRADERVEETELAAALLNLPSPGSSGRRGKTPSLAARCGRWSGSSSRSTQS